MTTSDVGDVAVPVVTSLLTFLTTHRMCLWLTDRDMPPLRFEVSNLDAYPTDLPGAVQHNAWWDAMALRHLLTT